MGMDGSLSGHPDLLLRVECPLYPNPGGIYSMCPLEEERPHVEGEFAMAGDLNCLLYNI